VAKNPLVSGKSSPRRLKNPKLFDPKAFLANGGVGRTVCSYRGNQAVFTQGDSAGAVFYIQQGRVRISALSRQGKEATIGVLSLGDFLGVECLNPDQLLHTTTARTISACCILRIEKSTMSRTLDEERALANVFIAHLVRRHKHTQADMLGLLFYSSEQRLARALLILANPERSEFDVVILFISQETLAEMVGTTLSRVNVFMNKFRKLGLIDYNGHNSGLRVHSSLVKVLPE
jgi:CRP-like cAMP-binding protein